MSKLTLSDVQTQSGGLHSLLYMLYEASCDLDYTSEKPGATDAANRVNHLIILARDEAERLDTAIGECIDNENAKARAAREQASNQIDNELIFDPRRPSLFGLFSLYDALGTVLDVISGLSCQPRFTSKLGSMELPPAGDQLQKLGDLVMSARDDIYKEALSRPVIDGDDRAIKLFFYSERIIDIHADPEGVVADLQKKLAKIGGAK
jgi:hypothetical protein